MSTSIRSEDRFSDSGEGNNHGIGNAQPQDDDSRTPLLGAVTVQSRSMLDKISSLLQNWWLWEIIGAATSVVCISIILVILLLYNSSSLPDWPFIFNINSTISLFGTIAKLSLGSAVSAAISQSKWLWYRQKKPRRLQDLQIFDDASRGPWGAVQLLISLHLRHLAVLGSVIMILLLLFDPFLQQVVSYPSRWVPAGEKATIVRAQKYEARNEDGLPLPSIVDLTMKSAIYNGIFDNQNNAELGIAHTCSSGNCTWPKFSSLAVCNKCVDIRHYVKRSCDKHGCHEHSLPDGPSLHGFDRQINSSVTNISSSLSDIYPSVVRFSSLIVKNVNGSDELLALECSLWYCIQTYQASVDGGKPFQNVLSSWRNDSAHLSQSHDFIFHPPSSIIDDITDPSVYRVVHLAATALNSFISEMFTGHGRLDDRGSAFSSDTIQAIYNSRNLTTQISNLAVSMTNNIREQNSSHSSPVLGTTWETETYVHVRWRWLSFPLVVLFLSLLFLLGSIIETTQSKVMIWKTNNLAILSHGRDIKLKHSHQDFRVDKLSRLGEQANSIMVELALTPDQNWKLVER